MPRTPLLTKFQRLFQDCSEAEASERSAVRSSKNTATVVRPAGNKKNSRSRARGRYCARPCAIIRSVRTEVLYIGKLGPTDWYTATLTAAATQIRRRP